MMFSALRNPCCSPANNNLGQRYTPGAQGVHHHRGLVGLTDVAADIRASLPSAPDGRAWLHGPLTGMDAGA